MKQVLMGIAAAIAALMVPAADGFGCEGRVTSATLLGADDATSETRVRFAMIVRDCDNGCYGSIIYKTTHTQGVLQTVVKSEHAYSWTSRKSDVLVGLLDKSYPSSECIQFAQSYASNDKNALDLTMKAPNASPALKQRAIGLNALARLNLCAPQDVEVTNVTCRDKDRD